MKRSHEEKDMRKETRRGESTTLADSPFVCIGLAVNWELMSMNGQDRRQYAMRCRPRMAMLRVRVWAVLTAKGLLSKKIAVSHSLTLRDRGRRFLPFFQDLFLLSLCSFLFDGTATLFLQLGRSCHYMYLQHHLRVPFF